MLTANLCCIGIVVYNLQMKNRQRDELIFPKGTGLENGRVGIHHHMCLTIKSIPLNLDRIGENYETKPLTCARYRVGSQ